MAFGLAVYASQRRSPDTTQDSLPVAGQALLDGVFTRKVPMKGFKVVVYISFPFPKLLGAPDASWAKSFELAADASDTRLVRETRGRVRSLRRTLFGQRRFGQRTPTDFLHDRHQHRRTDKRDCEEEHSDRFQLIGQCVGIFVHRFHLNEKARSDPDSGTSVLLTSGAGQ